jgi:GT2 family glycosyltransferase
MPQENDSPDVRSSHSHAWAVVANYNGAQWLRACLTSLLDSNYPLQIVVVDNRSTLDDSVAIIQKEYPQVHLIQSPVNLGFGKANNTGIKLALQSGADYVLLLNQDAWIEKDTVEKLVSASQRNPKYGIISPIHLNADKSALDYGFSVYIRPDKCSGLISDLYTNRLKAIYSLPFVNAAAWLVTRSCLETMGGFDPLFFMYGEDVDFCNRVLYHGFQIGIAPDATICHARESKAFAAKKNAALTKQEKSVLKGMDLMLLKNVNNPLLKQLAIWVLQSGLMLAENLLAGNFNRFGGISWMKLSVLLHTGKVFQNRKICKYNAHPFL